MDGTVDIDERASQWSREGWAGFDARAASDTPRSTAAGAEGTMRTEGEQVMPVVQEELQVGKRAVSNGGVRVIQRVTETPVKEMIRLRDERATALDERSACSPGPTRLSPVNPRAHASTHRRAFSRCD